MNEQNGAVVALVRDLMLSSRVTGAAKEAGVSVVMVREPSKLAEQPGGLLLVDLNQEGAIDAAAAWGRQEGRQVIGFVSHVDTSAIARAREAGIGKIMARSAFFSQLPALLSSPGS